MSKRSETTTDDEMQALLDECYRKLLDEMVNPPWIVENGNPIRQMRPIGLTKGRIMTEKTELEEYQEFVKSVSPDWVDYVVDEKTLIWAAGELAAEAGEVLGEAVKIIRKDENGISEQRFLKIIDELGDTLWGVAAVANVINVSLDDVIMHNIDKLNKREAEKNATAA